MLETVREHALDRLQTEGRLDDVRRRHAERFLELALTAETELAGPDQADWLNRLEREFDNLTRDARLAALVRTRGGRPPRRRALERFWRAHAHVSEARRWLALGLALGARCTARGPRGRAVGRAPGRRQVRATGTRRFPCSRRRSRLFRAESEQNEKRSFALSELG